MILSIRFWWKCSFSLCVLFIRFGESLKQFFFAFVREPIHLFTVDRRIFPVSNVSTMSTESVFVDALNVSHLNVLVFKCFYDIIYNLLFFLVALLSFLIFSRSVQVASFQHQEYWLFLLHNLGSCCSLARDSEWMKWKEKKKHRLKKHNLNDVKLAFNWFWIFIVFFFPLRFASVNERRSVKRIKHQNQCKLKPYEKPWTI